MTEGSPLPDPDTGSRLSWRSTALTIGMLAVFAAALWWRRDLVSASLGRVADLPGRWLLAVLAATVAMVVARALMVAAATPGLSPTRALAADQVQMASSNAVVGGGPIGASAKVGMMHSWGVTADEIATSLITTAVAPALVTWTIAALLFWPNVLLGDGGRTELALAVIGTLQIALLGTLVWIALTRPGLAATIGRLGDRVVRVVARTVPTRFTKAHRLLAAVHSEVWLETLRQDGLRLARSKGVPTMLASLAFQASTWVLLWSVLHGVGVERVSIGEVVLSVALVRALVSLSPTPGGIGVAELSLITALTNAGGEHGAVAAAVLLFRALTYLLPMVLGASAWLWWRRPSAVLARRATHAVRQTA